MIDIIWAFKLRPIKGWRTMLFLGILSLLLGFFVSRNFPLSGARIIGFLVGIRLILNGWAHVVLGGAVRREAKKAAKAG